MLFSGNKEKCKECGQEFKNSGQLDIHMEVHHPQAPKASEDVQTLTTTFETFNLEPGDKSRKLQVGDVFKHERQILVRKITKTDTSIKVEGEVIKRNWIPN